MDNTTCSAAASTGQLETLIWLRGKECNWSGTSVERAFLNEHLVLAQWAIDNGCAWNGAPYADDAARKRPLEDFQWARANGCPWDVHTCMCAAAGGHLEVLQWARDTGGSTALPKRATPSAYLQLLEARAGVDVGDRPCIALEKHRACCSICHATKHTGSTAVPSSDAKARERSAARSRAMRTVVHGLADTSPGASHLTCSTPSG
mmetsp:Transcript_24848/g.62903  ORF Transcript_24848/g.62903 Transcript_24848/m.62903 type:complete len:205 (-) Transcript_24848:669-1283(-)